MGHLLRLARFFLPTMLMLHLHPSVLATTNKLAAGDTLTPPNYITSHSGDFSFGFRSLDSSDTASSSLFLLAIWFHLDGTVVWFATDASPGSAVVATGDSVLSLAAAGPGQLSLSTPGNDTALWHPYTDPNRNYGTLLVMQDNGNLQFFGADGSTLVWESFRHPTDTLLPGQSMGPGTSLHSRSTDTDYSLGRFGLYVQTDGNIVSYITDLPQEYYGGETAYWVAGTYCCPDKDGNTTIFFDAKHIGHLYYQYQLQLSDGHIGNGRRNLTEPQPLRTNNTATRFYQRATLDPDGIIRVYILPNNTAADIAAAAWDVVSLFPSGGCEKVLTGSLHGLCGSNSYCTYRANMRLDCECPTGYVFLDPQSRYKGCIPAFLADECDGRSHSSEFKLVELPKTHWADAVYYKRHQSITEEQCRDLCLNNCLCEVAFFDGNSCSEAGMLKTGWQTNDTATRTLIKVRTKAPPRGILPYVVLIAGLALLFLATACTLLVYCYATKKEARKNHLGTRVFTHKELHRATNGFSRLLGQGGFGRVYHGMLKSLQPPDVAVKELRSADDYREEKFENEVQSIGRIHHRSLVRMVGYCKQGVHRMLVFEFMPRGSLGDFLFSSSQRPPWSWRAEAAIAIARGLEYLHYGCTTQIIHCDIKPDNILLDDSYAPKITDFGIARLLGDDKLKKTITHVRGTLGYLAPEWFNTERKVDSKVDVFSFGIVLLEIICCKKHPGPDQQDDLLQRNHDDQDLGMAVTLRAWAADLVREGNAERMVREDGDALRDLQRVERFARIAVWCVQADPSTRPTMGNVVRMLEGTMEVDPLPDPTTSRAQDFSAIPSCSGPDMVITSNMMY